MTGVERPTPPKDLETLLEEAIDSDPTRTLNALWEAIDALAEQADVEVPAPLVTKTITVQVDARFPAHGEFERHLAQRIHEVIGNEYMANSPELHGYEGPFVHRIMTRIEER